MITHCTWRLVFEWCVVKYVDLKLNITKTCVQESREIGPHTQNITNLLSKIVNSSEKAYVINWKENVHLLSQQIKYVFTVQK